jgi:hypothetical protein
MEIMTYILWMLLLAGSVMKNHLILSSVPRTEQAILTVEKTIAPKSNVIINEKKVLPEFVNVIKQEKRNQAYSWVDTS